MNVGLEEQCDLQIPAASVAPGSLFVATSLHVWFTGEPERRKNENSMESAVFDVTLCLTSLPAK